PVTAGHRLPSPFRIGDDQPAMDRRGMGREPNALIVRPPTGQGPIHAMKNGALPAHRLFPVNPARNSAHGHNLPLAESLFPHNPFPSGPVPLYPMIRMEYCSFFRRTDDSILVGRIQRCVSRQKGTTAPPLCVAEAGENQLARRRKVTSGTQGGNRLEKRKGNDEPDFGSGSTG